MNHCPRLESSKEEYLEQLYQYYTDVFPGSTITRIDTVFDIKWHDMSVRVEHVFGTIVPKKNTVYIIQNQFAKVETGTGIALLPEGAYVKSNAYFFILESEGDIASGIYYWSRNPSKCIVRNCSAREI